MHSMGQWPSTPKGLLGPVTHVPDQYDLYSFWQSTGNANNFSNVYFMRFMISRICNKLIIRSVCCLVLTGCSSFKGEFSSVEATKIIQKNKQTNKQKQTFQLILLINAVVCEQHHPKRLTIGHGIVFYWSQLQGYIMLEMFISQFIQTRKNVRISMHLY